jgi:hypothetical protein
VGPGNGVRNSPWAAVARPGRLDGRREGQDGSRSTVAQRPAARGRCPIPAVALALGGDLGRRRTPGAADGVRGAAGRRRRRAPLSRLDDRAAEGSPRQQRDHRRRDALRPALLDAG